MVGVEKTVCIQDNKNAYKILVGAPKGEMPLAGLGNRREDSINFFVCHPRCCYQLYWTYRELNVRVVDG
jgi:hypothetical protein